MNESLNPFLDAAPNADDLKQYPLADIRAVRDAARNVEIAAWKEEGRRAAKGTHESRMRQHREFCPPSMRERIFVDPVDFKRIRARTVMQLRDWALQVKTAAETALKNCGENPTDLS
jgi:hypothetical protein